MAQGLNPRGMKAASLLATGLFFTAVSCERHSWEETKVLHEEHHGGHEGHEGEAHAEHAEGDMHGTEDHSGHDH